MSIKTIIIVGNDEISQFDAEFSLLCSRLDVCEEIREGYYSDEALLADPFDMLATAEEMDMAVAALQLPDVTPGSELLDVLKAVRRYWALQ